MFGFGGPRRTSMSRRSSNKNNNVVVVVDNVSGTDGDVDGSSSSSSVSDDLRPVVHDYNNGGAGARAGPTASQQPQLPPILLQPHPRSRVPREKRLSSSSPSITRRRAPPSTTAIPPTTVPTAKHGRSPSAAHPMLSLDDDMHDSCNDYQLNHVKEEEDGVDIVDYDHNYDCYDTSSPDEVGGASTSASSSSPDSSPPRHYHFNGTGGLDLQTPPPPPQLSLLPPPPSQYPPKSTTSSRWSTTTMTTTTPSTASRSSMVSSSSSSSTASTSSSRNRRRYSSSASKNCSSNNNGSFSNYNDMIHSQQFEQLHHSRQEGLSSTSSTRSRTASFGGGGCCDFVDHRHHNHHHHPSVIYSPLSTSSTKPTRINHDSASFSSPTLTSASSLSSSSPMSVSMSMSLSPPPSSSTLSSSMMKKGGGCNMKNKSWSSVAVMFCSMVALSLIGTIMLTKEATNSLLPHGRPSSLSFSSSSSYIFFSDNADVDQGESTVVVTSTTDSHAQKSHSKQKKGKRKSKPALDAEYLLKLAAVEEGLPMRTTVSAAGLRGKIVQGRWDGTTTASYEKLVVRPTTAGGGIIKKSDKTNGTVKKKVEDVPRSSNEIQPVPGFSERSSLTDKDSTKNDPAAAATVPSQQPLTSSKLKMNLPPHLPALPYNYDKVDPRMYNYRIKNRNPPKSEKGSSSLPSSSSPPSSSSKATTSNESNSANNRNTPYPRVFLFDPTATRTSLSAPPKKIKPYPSDFTDNTQLYGILPSDDERLSHMEIREPYSDGECVPMQDWQTTYHPSCNGMHELGMNGIGDDTHGVDATLFGTGGFWRYAWRVDVNLPRDSGSGSKTPVDTVVLKTLKYEHNFEDAHFEHDRIDAVAMERLTASPHVINVFGFCGHSVLTEFADGPRVGALADKARKTPLERLRIARDVANGLADVHGIDGDGNTTFVHLDVNPANVVSVGGTLKLNDFNIGIIRRWNTTSNEPCGFPAQYPNPQWRSPEEARGEQNLTEKVDIFSLGHIFFRLICEHEPWNKLEPGGKPTKEEINRKVKKGIMPFIPDDIKNSVNPEIVAIRDAMISCYAYDPKDRPDARQIAQTLDRTLTELAAKITTVETPPAPVEQVNKKKILRTSPKPQRRKRRVKKVKEKLTKRL